MIKTSHILLGSENIFFKVIHNLQSNQSLHWELWDIGTFRFRNQYYAYTTFLYYAYVKEATRRSSNTSLSAQCIGGD